MRPHLTHLFMEVGDLERARWFWTQAIGLELTADRGPYIQVGGNGGFHIGIEQAPAGSIGPHGPEITVRVPDVDALTAELRELGVRVLDGPVDTPWGARHTWLLDPDGRRMSVYSSADPIMGTPATS
jgi:catechol 2,3-dioxygenase-like lactoylglutathione lyase family enzyme